MAKKKINISEVATKVVAAGGGGVAVAVAIDKVPVANPMIRSIGGIALGSIGVGMSGGNKIIESASQGAIGSASAKLAASLIPGLAPSVEGVGSPLDVYADEMGYEEVGYVDNEIGYADNEVGNATSDVAIVD